MVDVPHDAALHSVAALAMMRASAAACGSAEAHLKAQGLAWVADDGGMLCDSPVDGRRVMRAVHATECRMALLAHSLALPPAGAELDRVRQRLSGAMALGTAAVEEVEAGEDVEAGEIVGGDLSSTPPSAAGSALAAGTAASPRAVEQRPAVVPPAGKEPPAGCVVVAWPQNYNHCINAALVRQLSATAEPRQARFPGVLLAQDPVARAPGSCFVSGTDPGPPPQMFAHAASRFVRQVLLQEQTGEHEGKRRLDFENNGVVFKMIKARSTVDSLQCCSLVCCGRECCGGGAVSGRHRCQHGANMETKTALACRSTSRRAARSKPRSQSALPSSKRRGARHRRRLAGVPMLATGTVVRQQRHAASILSPISWAAALPLHTPLHTFPHPLPSYGRLPQQQPRGFRRQRRRGGGGLRRRPHLHRSSDPADWRSHQSHCRDPSRHRSSGQPRLSAAPPSPLPVFPSMARRRRGTT
jgi:hypothetical protein